MKRFGLGLSVALLALGVATSASAQVVKFEGCAVSNISGLSVMGGACTMINPLSSSYVVNSAKPPVPTMVPIRLTGTVVAGLTPCGAPALTGIKWKKIKKKTC
jgi:hypothetical protein